MNKAPITITSGADTVTFTPQDLSIQYESLSSSDSGRTDDGTMHIGWILRKATKLSITLPPHQVNDSTFARVLSLVQGQEYTATYYDYLAGTNKTKTFYTSNSSADWYSGIINGGIVQNVQFNAIEVAGDAAVQHVTPLSAPTLTLSNSQVSWTAVSNASNYTVIDNGVESTQTELSYTITTPYETHSIKVMANSNNVAYLSSDFSCVTYFPSVAAVRLTLIADPAPSGILTGSGEFTPNTNRTISAAANNGYTFSGWYNGSTLVSSQPQTSFSLGTTDVVLTAKFLTAQYKLDTPILTLGNNALSWQPVPHVSYYEVKENGLVRWTTDTTYSLTDTTTSHNITVQAIADTQSIYISSNIATYTYNPSGLVTLTLSVGLGQGTVSGGGVYPSSTTHTITATPASGYVFDGWYNGSTLVSEQATTSITLGGTNLSLTANFSLTKLATPSNLAISSSYVLTWNAVSGAAYYEVTENGNHYWQYTNNYTLGDVTTEHTITVQAMAEASSAHTNSDVASINFNPTPSPTTYTITASANPVSGGSIAGAGVYRENYSVTLSAVANSGYTFQNWTLNGTVVSTSLSYTFTCTGNASYVANFTSSPLPTVELILNVSPTGSGTVSGAGTYTANTSHQITATAASGYTFEGWYNGSVLVSVSSTYSVTLGTNDMTLTAQFGTTPPPTQYYTIQTSVNPTGSGTVSGAGVYADGATCTLTASPSSGFYFTSWTEAGVTVSNSATYSFSVSGNRTLVANISAEEPLVTTGPLCFTSLADNNTFQIRERRERYTYPTEITYEKVSHFYIQYSLDNKVTWNNASNTVITQFNLNEGQKVYIRAIPTYFNPRLYYDEVSQIRSLYKHYTLSFASNKNVVVSGNVTTLLDFNGAPAYEWDYNAFRQLFMDMTNLKSAEYLGLNSHQLKNYCYNQMFEGCTSLQTAPNLPAPTTIEGCYSRMFYGCSSLNKIIVHFNTWSAGDPGHHTQEWVYGVAATGTFYCPRDLEIVYGQYFIPTGWSVQYID